MTTRMLIDARHPEETRVVVVKDGRIEEFDFESAEHKQIKGNIYLAKVTRVEPSLQAAFVDFGGNRHGFLAFSEIHPDYYQIPKADREALLAEEAEAAAEEERLRSEEEDAGISSGAEYAEYDPTDGNGEALAEDLAENGVEEVDPFGKDIVSTIEGGASHEDSAEADVDYENEEPGSVRRGRHHQSKSKGDTEAARSRAKQVDELRAKRMALRRRYKIQDVIQRRQVLLVQVVKEERGNKGAALTTYLSLAGRYTVLMPNSASGGGISRKISSASDRKRLKEIVSELNLPKSMGLIVRTAGMNRTKPEIKRDFDYLARLWDEIREKTFASVAPALIHSDSDLIKRAIRDIYHRDIEEVLVEGEEAYKSAKAFMKLLMPSHARRVKAYCDPVPLFQRYGLEEQLRAMYDPVVPLKSGGYLVINPTEALVAIDINSGRATKEHNIEQTALNTNLEATKEIARQLRLRDMAGLVVIDFIDMEHPSNVRKVEKAMKEALKNDRARIQIGRISSFGLMEMSRQRLRTGVLEATTRPCPHCDGTGRVRTASSAALSALRLIEEEAAKGKGTQIRLAASKEAAFYLLNKKRPDLVEIEQRYGVTIEIVPEGENEGATMSISSSGPPPAQALASDQIVDRKDDAELTKEEATGEQDEAQQEKHGAGENDKEASRRSRKRRRRRGGRGRKRRDGETGAESEAPANSGEDGATEAAEARSDAPADEGTEIGEARPKKRRRRGGRGRKRGGASETGEAGALVTETSGEVADASADTLRGAATPEVLTESQAETAAGEDAAIAPAEKPKRKRAPRKPKGVEPEAQAEAVVAVVSAEEAPGAGAEEVPAAEERPKRKRAARKTKIANPQQPEAAEIGKPQSASLADPPEQEADAAPRKGWWSRTFGE